MIRKFCFDSEVEGPNVLILAGVHGDEYEPMVAAMNLIEELPAQLEKGGVTIIPVANELAYLIGSRCTPDGVDLARSFPGKEDGSRIERVADSISDLIKNADYLIDMHTGGAIYTIYPMVGYMLLNESTVLKQQQNMAVACGLPLIWGTDHRPNGRSLSIAREYKVPAVYFEYGGGSGFCEEIVKTYKEACRGVLSSLSMLNEPCETSKKYRYWLEDRQLNSGHLQVKMPAPSSGIFRTKVKVGDYIRKGEVFGIITDIINNETHEVVSQENGLVFLLRCAVYINRGDALGGVLPVELMRKKVIEI